jgi:hypothetical protein
MEIFIRGNWMKIMNLQDLASILLDPVLNILVNSKRDNLRVRG